MASFGDPYVDLNYKYKEPDRSYDASAQARADAYTAEADKIAAYRQSRSNVSRGLNRKPVSEARPLVAMTSPLLRAGDQINQDRLNAGLSILDESKYKTYADQDRAFRDVERQSLVAEAFPRDKSARRGLQRSIQNIVSQPDSADAFNERFQLARRANQFRLSQMLERSPYFSN